MKKTQCESSVGNKEIQYVRDNSRRFIDSLNDDGISNDKQFGGMVIVWRAMTIMVRALYAFFDNEVEDGRSTPLIHACIGIGDHCCASFLDFLLHLDPDQVSRLDTRGNLPLHIAAKSNQFVSLNSKAVSIKRLIGLYPKGPSGRVPLAVGIMNCESCGSWMELLGIEEFEEQDQQTRLKPFMLAASSESKSSLDMTYEVFRANPNAIIVK